MIKYLLLLIKSVSLSFCREQPFILSLNSSFFQDQRGGWVEDGIQHTSGAFRIPIPFGLTFAPAVIQAMIYDVFRNFLICLVFVYLDDILIFF